jgi:hypothetical protein
MTRVLHALPVLLYLPHINLCGPAVYSTKTIRSCTIRHDHYWATAASIGVLSASAAMATMARLTDRRRVPTLQAFQSIRPSPGTTKARGEPCDLPSQVVVVRYESVCV